jgi:uncharacterized protein YjbI with pentapeptide repeats
MTTRTYVNSLRKPNRIPRNPDEKAGIATRKAIINRSIAVEVRRDPSWVNLPVSLVVSKLRSSDHSVILQAVEELRARGRLSDNTLSWAGLQYANLQGANLGASNLTNADLHKANLEAADLSYANLNGARLTRARLQGADLDKASLDGASLIGANLQGVKNLSDEQLAQVSRLRVATMPDGNLYDGRFNLQGDFADASILHVDLNNPAAIAAFYGVSLEDFLRGQQWQKVNMPSASTWHESVCFQNAELVMNWL